MGLIRTLGVLCMALALFATPFAASRVYAGVDSSNFTADEWRRLEAGELVLRPVTRTQGGMKLMGGSSWQVIDAPPEVVWRALLDTPRYHRMLPQVLEAKLVRKSDNTRTVFLRQGAQGLMEAKYYLRVNVHEERRDITFTIDDELPHEGLRAAWGFYTVRNYRDGKTLLAYGVMADIGGGLMAAVMRGHVHDWMLRTPSLVKRFLEGSGRGLYR
jgi:ribosome-associated toxin RatA of RatAB toxin-antitoxin module